MNPDWIPFYKPPDIAQPVEPAAQEIEVIEVDTRYVDEGRIVDADRLNQGGNLLIVPFLAGPGVESNERLDELSLRMVQGIVSELEGNRPYFNILTNESKEQADFVLRGFFIDVGSMSKLKSWLPGINEKEIAIKGQMTPRGSDKPVLLFEDSISTTDKAQQYIDMSYALGQDLGRFIRSGTEF